MSRFTTVLLSLAIVAIVHASSQDTHVIRPTTDPVKEAIESIPLPNAAEFPHFEDHYILFEDFQQGNSLQNGKVIPSTDSKYDEQRLSIEEPHVSIGAIGDKMLVAKLPAKHYGFTLPFDKPVSAGDDTFVIQYEVQLQNGLDCGGAYIKLVSAETDSRGKFEPTKLNADSPYAVMFGPDRCGDTDKVHLIIRHQNPNTKQWSEHHLRNPPRSKSDQFSHLYTLILRADNSYTILIDAIEQRSGSLLEDFEPAINPPQLIPDPNDKKPVDWVDEKEIADPDAMKPSDWDEDEPEFIPDPDAEKPPGWLDDEPAQIPDPSALKPVDWDDEEDGEWEAPAIANPVCDGAAGCGQWQVPLIRNPRYRGKWTLPMIPNPEYKGEWEPRNIPNPDYFEDLHPHRLHDMAGVSVEIWTLNDGISFDHFLVTKDEDAAVRYGQRTTVQKLSKQTARSNARARAERKKQRHADLESGDPVAYFNYVIGETADIVMEHTWAAVVTTAAMTAMSLYFCCNSQDTEESIVFSPEMLESLPNTEQDEQEDSAESSGPDAHDTNAESIQNQPVSEDAANDEQSEIRRRR